MRLVWWSLIAIPLVAQEQPRQLATAEQLERAAARAAALPWAKAALDVTVNAAKAWPQSHLSKYGLKTLALPTEGGQWTLWDVCPVHGVSLRYTPPSTKTCPIDGKTYSGWPYDQVTYDRRHDDLANAARDLALAWRFTGEAAYAEQAAWILKQYAASYLSFPYHDKDNRNTRSGARVHAQTLDESVWLVPMAWAYDLLAGSPALTPADRAAIERNLLRAAVETIQRYDAGVSNWQSWHNAAIGAVGFALADEALIHAAIDGKSGFRFQMDNSVTPDGFWYEGAWGYHFYALDPLLRLARMAVNNGIDLFADAHLKSMFDAPLKLVLPSGNLPAFNDSKEVGLYGYDTLYEFAWAQYQEPAYAGILGRRSRGLNALLWGEAELPEVELTSLQSAAFPESGYAVLRAPETDHTLAIKFGPHGGGHGHYDKLNFVSFANGATLGVDPGTQSYAAPTHATWDKVTLAHNTVVVDESTQAESSGALVWADLDGPVYRAVRATAGESAYKQARLTRTMLLTDDYALDVMEAEGIDGKAHQFDWAYHNVGGLRVSVDVQPGVVLPATHGYQHLEGARGVVTNDAWQAVFDPSPTQPVTYGSVYNSTSAAKGRYESTREQAAGGLYSGKASYEFSGSSYILFTTPALSGLPAALPGRVSLMVFGDGSGHQLAVRLNDATDERFVKVIGPVTWTGWRRIEVEDVSSWSHYLGNADGVFDLPVRTFGLEWTYRTGGPASGALFVDDIAIDETAVEDFEVPPRNLRLWMLGAPETAVLTANGLGPDLTKPVPLVLARRNAESARFLTLLEPFRQEPAVLRFELREDGLFEVETARYVDRFRLTAEGVQSFERIPAEVAAIQ